MITRVCKYFCSVNPLSIMYNFTIHYIQYTRIVYDYNDYIASFSVGRVM